jgi:hypothetical protein
MQPRRQHTFWEPLIISPKVGGYEYEHDGHDYTGWVRCIGGQMANGVWPMWNSYTGEERCSITGRVLKRAKH